MAAKQQRRSINDALAEIAVKGEDQVARDHVARDNEPRSHAALPARSAPPAPAIPRGYDEHGYRVRIRREKPHVSLYAHPRTFQVIRELAQAQGRKAHDLYTDGLRLMLAEYGYDYDALERGEG